MSEEVSWAIVGPNVRNRKCGSCKLCCTLLPVKALNKPANVACVHLCSRGCGIYARRPDDCRYFSCRWLMDGSTGNMRRPDKVGYVIDPMLDTLIINDEPHACVQIWCDPDRRDAHRDPALREWLNELAVKHRLLALVRWHSNSDGMALVAPCLSMNGRWNEHHSQYWKSEAEMAPYRAMLIGGKG